MGIDVMAAVKAALWPRRVGNGRSVNSRRGRSCRLGITRVHADNLKTEIAMPDGPLGVGGGATTAIEIGHGVAGFQVGPDRDLRLPSKWWLVEQLSGRREVNIPDTGPARG